MVLVKNSNISEITTFGMNDGVVQKNNDRWMYELDRSEQENDSFFFKMHGNKQNELFEIVNDRLNFISFRPWTNDLEIFDIEVVSELFRSRTIQKLFVTIGNDFAERILIFEINESTFLLNESLMNHEQTNSKLRTRPSLTKCQQY